MATQPARARPPARHADAGAASRGVAGRPIARHGRADHDALSSCSRRSASSRTRSARQLADGAEIAMVVLDNRTGGVVAWLGGDDFFGRAGQVDLVRARRSPGSALKPLIYAMAFDDRTLHPETLVEDVPVRFRDWLPRNFDRDHQGAVTRAPRPAAVAERAGRAGAGEGRPAALPRRRCARPASRPACRRAINGNSLGVALGSATVSPLEMAGLYSGLANGGNFAPPQVRRDRPKPAAGPPRRARPPPGTSPTCWPTRRCPRASPRCPWRCATAASPSRPAPRPASAMPGPPATAPTGRSSSGSAMPTARRVPASSAASRRCPSCSRPSAACPAEDNRAIRPPADVIGRLPSRTAAAHAHARALCARRAAVRASPIRRPTPASSWPPARPCR